MNRFWGSKADSERQAAERDQRAARRYLASNPLHRLGTDAGVEDSDYEDAESSLLLNVDGGDDNDDMATAEAAAAAHKAAELLKPFEDQDFPDDDEAWKKSLSLKFDRNDVPFWFSETQVTLTNKAKTSFLKTLEKKLNPSSG